VEMQLSTADFQYSIRDAKYCVFRGHEWIDTILSILY
jgi:hypothetical protein